MLSYTAALSKQMYRHMQQSGMSIPKPLGQYFGEVSCQKLSALNLKPGVATFFKFPFSTAFWEAPRCIYKPAELVKLPLPLRPPESWGTLLELSFDQGIHLLQHLDPVRT